MILIKPRGTEAKSITSRVVAETFTAQLSCEESQLPHSETQHSKTRRPIDPPFKSLLELLARFIVPR